MWESVSDTACHVYFVWRCSKVEGHTRYLYICHLLSKPVLDTVVSYGFLAGENWNVVTSLFHVEVSREALGRQCIKVYTAHLRCKVITFVLLRASTKSCLPRWTVLGRFVTSFLLYELFCQQQFVACNCVCAGSVRLSEQCPTSWQRDVSCTCYHA